MITIYTVVMVYHYNSGALKRIIAMSSINICGRQLSFKSYSYKVLWGDIIRICDRPIINLGSPTSGLWIYLSLNVIIAIY